MAPAAGAVVSTVREIEQFYAAPLGGRLLPSAQQAELLRTVQIRGGANEYGLGRQKIYLTCGIAWGHGGSVPGYLTLAVASADHSREAVVLVNASPSTSRQGDRIGEALNSAFCR